MGLEKLDTNGIKMIVHAGDASAIEIATDMSSEGPDGTARHVIIITRDELQQVKDKLHPTENKDQYSYDHDRVMSLSTINKVAEIIGFDEILDYISVGQAYGKAGLSEFN